MRIEHEVVSLSWIPSEAIGGAMRVPFDKGFTHYDDPPPDRIDDLDALQAADRFRFANQLRAWIDVDDDGAITGSGYSGGIRIGSTTVLPGRRRSHTFEGFNMPTIQAEPEVAADGRSVRFVQTCGGRTGLPAPRRVNHPPFVQWRAPTVWSTLALTIRADGTAELDVISSSPFPRHWIYGPDTALAAKSGLTDFKDWYRHAFGKHTPWGEEGSRTLVTAAETALERLLSTEIMRGGEKPAIRKLKAGAVIAVEGEEASDLFLLLDGVVRVDVDGAPVAEMGPGAIFGERAILNGGRRTATLVAVTACRLAVAAAGQLDPAALAEVAEGHQREGS
jgi:hypothetical protein